MVLYQIFKDALR